MSRVYKAVEFGKQENVTFGFSSINIFFFTVLQSEDQIRVVILS